MGLGDDVIDLDEVLARPPHPRFPERVLTVGEQARAAGEPRLLWALFAIKEAAWKAATQLLGPVSLSPRRFEVAPELTSVRLGALVFEARLSWGDGWVHAAAWRGAPPLTSGVCARRSELDPGVAARAALCRALAERLGWAADELDVVRDRAPASASGLGPPRLLRNRVPVPGGLSLSHDGRFVSWAWRTAP